MSLAQQRGGLAPPDAAHSDAVAAPVSAAAAPAPATPQVPPVDRSKVCPFLLRCFHRHGGHHRLEEYQQRGQEPNSEFKFYTWADADLREITELVQEAIPSTKRATCRLEFAFVYPDRRGRNVMRQVGSTHATRSGPDDKKTLRELSFQTGDYLDIAIL